MAIQESLAWEVETPDLATLSINGLRLVVDLIERDEEIAEVIHLHPVSEPELETSRTVDADDLYEADKLPLGTASLSPWKALLKNADEFPSLDASAEKRLAQAIESGDNQAKQELTLSNLRLVASIAKPFAAKYDMNDLVQAGCEGLLRASDNFSWQKNNKFSTYATDCIRNAILDYTYYETRVVRIPAHMHKKVKKVRVEEIVLTNKNGRMLAQKDDSSVAEAVGLSESQLQDVRRAFDDPISLQAPAGKKQLDPSDLVLQDLIQNNDPGTQPETTVLAKDSTATLRQLMGELDKTEAFLIKGKFGFYGDKEITIKSLSEQLGISPNTAGLIADAATQKMRDKAEQLGISFDMLISDV